MSENNTEPSAVFPIELANQKFDELYKKSGVANDTHDVAGKRWIFTDGYLEGFAKGRESCEQLGKDLANARWAKKQWSDQAAIQKDQIINLEAKLVEANAELERKEKLLHDMWDHTMDCNWPLVKLKQELAEANAKIERLKKGEK